MSLKLPDSCGTWKTSFSATYIRKRNSRSGTKNIRCFPSCAPDHNNAGFCGGSATLKVEHGFTEGQSDLFHGRARFEVTGENSSDSVSPALLRNELATDVRTSKNPTAEWIPVIIEKESNSSTLVCVINPGLLGWHYGWRSNKSTASKLHSLRVYLYSSKTNSDEFHFVGKFSSPPFIIVSGARAQMAKPSLNVKVESPEPYESKRDSSSFPSPDHSTWSPCEKRKHGVNLDEKQTHQRAIEVLTRQKVDEKHDSKPDKPESIRALLSATIIHARSRALQLLKSRENIYDHDSLVSVLDMFSDDTFLSVDETNRPDGECDNGNDNASGHLENVEGVEDDSSDLTRNPKVIAAISRSIRSSELSKKLSDFFEECSSGTIGDSLCEALCRLDDVNENPFIREFAKSLFAKFQLVISKHIWSDLYEKGLVDSAWGEGVRGCSSTTYEASHVDRENLGLLYDPEDLIAVNRFIQKIKRHNASPSNPTEMVNLIEPDPKFEIVSKTWTPEETANQINFFVDILANQLGYMDKILANIYANTFCGRITLSVTEKKIGLLFTPKFGMTGYLEMTVDGVVRHANFESPIYEYVEPPPKREVGKHWIDEDGNYVLLEISFYKYSDLTPPEELRKENLEDGFIVCCHCFKVTSENPDRMSSHGRVFHMNEDPASFPLSVWFSNKMLDYLDAELVTYYVACPQPKSV
mmetsp:Transcript_15240/g.17782  ORF Transcript_15240/g.17782 Transcript_15240/m.17782 type:complete len:696 (-) Transcript_15240:856-2943(-)